MHFHQSLICSCISFLFSLKQITKNLKAYNTNVLSSSSRNQNSEIKLLAGLCSFQRLFPCLFKILEASCILSAAVHFGLLPPSSKNSCALHWAHSGNPGFSPHLKILTLIVSVKSLWPYNITLTGSGDQDMDILQGHYSTYHRSQCLKYAILTGFFNNPDNYFSNMTLILPTPA